MKVLIAFLCIFLIFCFSWALLNLGREARKFYLYEMKHWRWRRMCNQWQRWGT